MYVVLIVVFLLLYLYYKLVIKPNRFWQSRNIAYKKILPIVGDKGMLGLTSVVDMALEDYQEFKEEPFFGSYFLTKPTVYINEPNLIRDVTIKDFDHFMDHSEIGIQSDLDPILAESLVFKTGKPWRDMRSILSPLFTGRKIRLMFDQVVECSQSLVNFYTDQVKTGKPVIIDMKDVCGRLTGDTIASCAFGIKCDSVRDPNNEFYKMAKILVNFDLWRTLATIFFKKICLMLDFGVVPKKVYRYFESFMYETIKVREDEQIYRPDMIQLMMQIRKGDVQQDENIEDEKEFAAAKDTAHYLKKVSSQYDLKDQDILAQVLIFLLGGYDTSSTALSFIIHQLTVCTDIQERLQEEINKTLEETKGKIDYEGIRDMKYLDMVISEGMRMYTPGALSDRLCTKDYVLKAKNKEILIEKGMSVMIPVVGIHHDPKYYPNPFKFDPERFSKENYHKIQDSTYFPFGNGPRNCIGSRFALMQMKVAIFLMLSKFNICVCSKTQIPIRYKKIPNQVLPEKGIWVELKLRNIS